MEPKWLTWAKEIQAISQNGLAYTKDIFDKERFERLRELSVEIINQYTEIDNEVIRDLFCNETGYQTPKVDVRGVIIKEEKILLVKEKNDGKWTLPGGWADYNLSIKENVTKEVFEESGYRVIPQKLIALQDRNKHNQPATAYGIYKAFVECEIIEGRFIPNHETAECDFFTPSNLPPLSEGRVTKEQILLCFNSINNNLSETIFD